MENKVMTPVQAIRAYMETPDRPLRLGEFAELTGEERLELALLCADELGVTLQYTSPS